MKFTEANVKGHKSDKPNYSMWDENMPGFGFRVQAGGSKVYYAKYRMGKKQRWLKIGAVDQISLAAAAKQAKTFFESVAKSIDPADTKALANSAAEHSFGSQIEPYLAVMRINKLSEGHINRTRSHLEESFSGLHSIAIPNVNRATVARELEQIAKRGPVVANRARSILQAYFNWLIGKGLGGDFNPVDKTNKFKEYSRDRELTAKELKLIWHALPENEFGQIVKLLMLTCTRKSEMADLFEREVTLSDKMIELPGTKTKNGYAHMVPMSAPVISILQTVNPINGRFFKKRNNWQYDKDKLDAAMGFDDWTFHDFRRTGVTLMGNKLGVLPHVGEAILNHYSGTKAGVAGIYNKAQYLNEKAKALDDWAAWLMDTVK